MSSIRQVRTALAAAQLGSFVAAGRHVGLTQAAVSLQIKNLESELDTQLFERRAQAAVPTPHGRQILAELEDLVARYEQLLAQSGDTLRGSLRIGTLVSSLMGTFGTVLARIKRDYPGLHITLLAGQSADFAARVAAGGVPTPHGRRSLADGEDLGAGYGEWLGQSGDTLRGSLRIGTLVSSRMGTFGTVLARIKRDYPGLHITLLAGQSADFAARVAAGELDAAVVTEPPHGVEPTLVWTPLYQVPLVLIAAADRKSTRLNSRH